MIVGRSHDSATRSHDYHMTYFSLLPIAWQQWQLPPSPTEESGTEDTCEDDQPVPAPPNPFKFPVSGLHVAKVSPAAPQVADIEPIARPRSHTHEGILRREGSDDISTYDRRKRVGRQAIRIRKAVVSKQPN